MESDDSGVTSDSQWDPEKVQTDRLTEISWCLFCSVYYIFK